MGYLINYFNKEEIVDRGEWAWDHLPYSWRSEELSEENVIDLLPNIDPFSIDDIMAMRNFCIDLLKDDIPYAITLMERVKGTRKEKRVKKVIKKYFVLWRKKE